jgi:hypothetical protein
VDHEVHVQLRPVGTIRAVGAHRVVAQHRPDGLRDGQVPDVGQHVELARQPAQRTLGDRDEQPEPLVEAHVPEPVDVAAPERDPDEVRAEPLAPHHVQGQQFRLLGLHPGDAEVVACHDRSLACLT